MFFHDSLTGMVCLAVRSADLLLLIPRSLPLGALSFSLAWLPAWILVAGAVLFWLCFRWIPNDRIGVVEKWWSLAGSVTEGRIIAPAAEAGYQADILRGGLHFGWWRWQYAIHTAPLVSIPEGKIGYVFARDGEPLPPSQTLARVIDCNNFQDARGFLGLKAAADATTGRIAGQKGRQRAILREGVYAINPALFTVISENAVFALKIVQTRAEQESLGRWLAELRAASGFEPVVVGKGTAVAAIPDHDSAVVAAETPADSLAESDPTCDASARAATGPTCRMLRATRKRQSSFDFADSKPRTSLSASSLGTSSFLTTLRNGVWVTGSPVVSSRRGSPVSESRTTTSMGKRSSRVKSNRPASVGSGGVAGTRGCVNAAAVTSPSPSMSRPPREPMCSTRPRTWAGQRS